MPRYQPPSWSPYAEEILQRLSFTVTLRDDAQNGYGSDMVRTAPEADGLACAMPELLMEAEPPPEDDDLPGLDDLGFDKVPDGGPNDAARDRPQPSVVQVSVALRLAATFGSNQAFLRCLAPGAVMVLGGVELDEVRVIGDVLRLAFFPPGCRIGSKPAHVRHASSGDRPAILRLAPETDGEGISALERSRFHRNIAEALELAVPLLILQPADAAPEPDLARYLPAPVRLAAVDREIMLHHLRLAYGDEIDADALRDVLPPDTALADLQDIALRVSLRAPDALEAARRLTGFFGAKEKAAVTGPRLEHIAGDSEALTAVRQLVADLSLWQQ
ncbi:hypothetical protein [Tabrizicola sp.]|jgi:hypothetical protein|uniref:hypothetical protein n=1 Tax=Tabrizicola sp. TaxID=2005166 RepID=UPI0035B0CAC0